MSEIKMCVKCGIRPRLNSETQRTAKCGHCISEAAKNKRKLDKANGKCFTCANKALAGYTQCGTCIDKATVSRKKSKTLAEMSVYVIRNKVNNKVYVGQTTQLIERRWSSHLSEAKNLGKVSHWYNAIRAYGKDAFEWFQIRACQSKKDLDYWETHYIGVYDATNPERGYNVERYGNGGGPRSESARAKNSAFQKTLWASRSPEERAAYVAPSHKVIHDKARANNGTEWAAKLHAKYREKNPPRSEEEIKKERAAKARERHLLKKELKETNQDGNRSFAPPQESPRYSTTYIN